MVNERPTLEETVETGAGNPAGSQPATFGRKLWLWGLLVVCLLAAVLGYPRLRSIWLDSRKAGQAVAAAEAVAVEVAPVTRGDITVVSLLPGRVTALQEVNVTPKIPGRLKMVNVDVGDRVHQGQVLAVLDDAEIAAQVKQAEAGVVVAERSAEAAAAALEEARRNLERVQQLYDAGAASLQQLQQAQTAYDQASAGVADAQVDLARAALETAQVQQANTVITAPMSGVVAVRLADPGEYATPPQPILTLVNLEQVLIETSVSEAQVVKLALGQSLKVKVPAVGEGTINARITSISPAPDPKTRLFAMRALAANPGSRLKPGMTAEVSLVDDVRANVVKVPVNAVLNREGGRVVYLVEGDRARERQVETGLSDTAHIEIKSGLAVGESLVVSGQDFLADGSRIVVRSSANSARTTP